jgi:hypothetical protein
MDTTTLEQTRDVVDYLVFMVNEFALKHKISATQSFEYLKKFGGIEFLDDFYDIEHCENPNITLISLQTICSREGGYL